MSKLAMYLERVSQEDAELETEVEVEQSPEEIAVQEAIVENEIEVPEVDEDITPEAVAETEDEAEEAAEEIESINEEIEEVNEFEEEVEEEIESMEEFQSILEHGLRTKTYSPQFAAAVQLKLNKMGDVLSSEVPSLENYGGQDLEQFYTVSLETFQGFVKRLNDAVQSVSRNLAKKMRAVPGGAAAKYSQHLQKRADLIIKSPAVAEPKAIKTKALSVQLAIGGKANNDAYKALMNDFKQGTTLLRTTIPESIKYYNDIVDIIERAVKDGGTGKTGAIVAEATKLKMPTIPEEMYTDGITGGIMFEKQKETEKKEDIRSLIKDIGSHAVPTFTSNLPKGEAGEVTIDKATADKIAKQAKANVALADKIRVNHIEPLMDAMDKRLDIVNRAVKGANATSWSENKDLNLLAKQLRPLLTRISQLLHNVHFGILNGAENALLMAENALKHAEKTVSKVVSNEEHDLTVSNEGWLGAVAGFVGTSVIGFLIPFAGGAAIGAGAKAKMQKLQQDIEVISERIAKIRNGQIDEATKKGLQLPKDIKRVDGVDVAKGAVWGMLFGPIYGAVKGSEIENEYKKLRSKLDELEKVMKQAGIEPEGNEG